MITASLTLNGDLSCPSGDGLDVTGSSVVLNLNGHTVSGSGTAFAGVAVSGRSDTIENGLIQGFLGDAGVLVTSTGLTDTVIAVRVMHNADGIDDLGTRTKLTNDLASFNSGIGIYGNGTGPSTYAGDHELRNQNGIGLLGNKVTVSSNIAEANEHYGIFDQGMFTTLTKNIVNFNGFDGINVNEAAGIDGGGNSAKENDWASSVPPIPGYQCVGVVCT